MTTDSESVKQFNWQPQPRAFALVKELTAAFLSSNLGAANFSMLLFDLAGGRFIDWIDTIQLPRGREGEIVPRLLGAGFTRTPMPGQEECYTHAGGMFPAVVLVDGVVTRFDIKVDSVADFLSCWKLDHQIEGEPLSQMRRAKAFESPSAEMWVIERHGYRGFEKKKPDPQRGVAALRHLDEFRRRNRVHSDDHAGFAYTNMLIDNSIRDIGRDWTCDIFFQAEREYWERRNHAGRVQKARQNKLGLGWANHDHHTYRSGRHCYKDLISTLEKLGFHCREVFYAGAEAGWGAQVLEQPVAGITIFADVDLAAEELEFDFPHDGLPERHDLGTIGLWCALHGEAFLQAGMHHLECMFDWHALKDQLASEAHIRMMDPFTTMPVLRQAFTQGERWMIEPARIDVLLKKGQITQRQADDFRLHGAIGSHLENLERNDGFKGFNQHGVSQIIAKTDPRRGVELAAAAR